MKYPYYERCVRRDGRLYDAAAQAGNRSRSAVAAAGHVIPTVTQNVYLDPLPEEIRRAGEGFKIDLEQERNKKMQRPVLEGPVSRPRR